MKKGMLWRVLAHVEIVLAGMFTVFFAIDRVNPAMDFIASDLSKWLLLALSLAALTNGIRTVWLIHSEDVQKFDRENREKEGERDE